MKIKTFNIYILFILFAMTFSSCEEENDLKLSETNHQVIYTSEMDFENTIQVNGKISFSDVSQGITSREWTFPENVVDIIDSENDLTSNEVTVKTYFNEAGIYNVNLHQVYKGDAYVGETIKGQTLDTTIVVTVLDYLSASITANYINEDGSTGAALNLVDMAENEVTASKSIRFSQSTIGGPENFNWTFEGGDPGAVGGNENSIDVKYKKLGVYDVTFIASRTRPSGMDTVYIKDLIKVIPSTDPVDLEKVTNDENGNILLLFSREMDAFTLNKDNFSISIENEGNTIPAIISNASVDTADGTIVVIELDGERVYDNDIVKVSYIPGVLATTDAVNATAFTDIDLVFNTVNILEPISFDHSFENSTASNWPFSWWNNLVHDLSIVTDESQDGSQSAYIELHENSEKPDGSGQWMWVNHKDLNGVHNTVYFEADKTYEIGMWLYLVDRGNPTGDFDPDVRIYWEGPFDWNTPPLVEFTSDFPTGEWVYKKLYYTFGESKEYIMHMRGWNPINTERVKYYMDNINIAEVSLRP